MFLQEDKGLSSQHGGIGILLSFFHFVNPPDMYTLTLPISQKLPSSHKFISTCCNKHGLKYKQYHYKHCKASPPSRLKSTLHLFPHWTMSYLWPSYIYLLYSSDSPNNLSMMSDITFSSNKCWAWNYSLNTGHFSIHVPVRHSWSARSMLT